MKKQRQSRILEWIGQRPIDTQEELLALLRQDGYKVTQATVSRDMKELRITKTVDEAGRSRYAPPQPSRPGETAPYADIFARSVIRIDCAMNDVVIHCYSGMAPGVGAALDSMKWEMVLGTLAGDDTILAITRDETAALELVKSLNAIIAGRASNR
ncbi:MAG: arginine repressor [Clostridiales bacterium]|nr:arginine repressor [Clostridiales bacterium]